MIFPPALILIIGGLFIGLLVKSDEKTVFNNVIKVIMLLLPIATLIMVWSVIGLQGTEEGNHIIGNYVSFSSFKIMPIFIHPFTPIFATVFCLAAFSGALFSFNKINPLEISSAFIYAGSAIGATFSGDLISLFIYWELMAIASTIVVFCGAHNQSKEKKEIVEKSGLRYAYMHFVGGVILLAGITAHTVITGTAEISSLSFEYDELISNIVEFDLKSIAILLIFIGVLINAAAPPFSSWLADSYPEASAVGTVFLSAFTTKTAVFVLLTIFAGTKILIPIGLFMVFYGIIYAMLENDSRKILSYSVVNQVGFMVTGIGIGSDLALYGVAAHAFCHIIYKALLFMSAGSVMYMTGKTKCTDLGGLWHSMRLTTICGIIGALAISAFPWTSGFVSKSMISSSSAYENMMFVWILLLAASAGVFLHAGIKFPWFVFFQKDSGLRPEDPPMNMRLAMIFLSAMCILPGLFPEYLYNLLPVLEGGKLSYHSYSVEHVVTQLQLLLFAGLAFFVLLPMLKRTETISLDFDWVYRVILKTILIHIERITFSIVAFAEKNLAILVKKIEDIILLWHAPNSPMARSWMIGTSLLITSILLLLFLLLNYKIH